MHKIYKIDIINNLQRFDNTLIKCRLGSGQLGISFLIFYLNKKLTFVVELFIWVVHTNIVFVCTTYLS